ncbi:NAD(P)H-dependent oxidoreductase [Pseudosulfitobacter pseudonitzschiae]|uniref:NAD(P)H-dependent oxidoreductase n=1 Tax=Pseudosulfitobacter pseudonitzschiae TaxID=1402135 RepID=UPI001AF37554|nr:NAD(P)H-dependent oxidoreductase [Pseudosulfitobacter pseudonitzschiae]MBM1814307.1 NAD(P)H-dependent oxidoreductase [Pseudosulfitobacter pseudonitzschiae]MBM1831300.1 NAD(P)H-dependent oxidoreductase [Pseudosulfitobacter pseudonitzschiae]MBM1836167.1 NAD(P)H-dependent oxidoreductase [Pseudosulfitobacter pseudonitzschiae]MBM1841013.1 NAD(P)H-dependent oxidoreductase [Pseudosulfitobacter pseudonitzschiae]MBM1845881.1 NAD(P)H-dependent oxidoreductase [Pseudosulfitobacter pseudonitzschiae]
MANETICTLINTFTPKEGKADKLLDVQLDEIAALRGTAAATGWLGNEVYRATDGSKLVIVTRFRSHEAKEQWAASPEFAAHLERIGPFLEHVVSTPVELAGAFRGLAEDAPLRLAVITGSTREGRFSEKPAAWIAEKAAAHGGFDVTEIDLRDVNLPFLGDPNASKAQKQAAETFGARMAEFDAYLFTVAEYNHGPTAVLKNALDHGDWARKPAGLVGYGGVGGARAVEHVRGIAAELEMVTMQAAVHINFGNYLAVANGEKRLDEFTHVEKAADKMLGQLLWWGRALRAARTAAATE